MIIPDYNGNNIVNLISSIKGFCGMKSEYKNLDLLIKEDLDKCDNMVLFLIDALGYNWLEKYAKNSFLYSHLKGKITSIFPSTTSSAITTISTGKTPFQHSVIGWNMYTKETGSIIQVLPWKHSILDISLGDNISERDIFEEENFYSSSNKEVYVVTHKDYLASKYNDFHNKNSIVLDYQDLGDYFSQIKKALQFSENGKYIYAYWGLFDTLCHDYGYDSKEVYEHFLELDNAFKKFYELNRNNNIFLITADHGQIKVDKDKIINIKQSFPELYDMLIMPLAGEPRFQYCFVNNERKREFRDYVSKNLANICDIYSKQEILDKNLFGLGKPNDRFLERIGDFLLLPKDNYLICDNEKERNIGYHGGMTDWEMFVPLIIMK